MEMKHKIDFVKRSDQSECILSMTTDCNLNWLLICIDEFKSHIMQRISEWEAKQAQEKAKEPVCDSKEGENNGVLTNCG